MLFVENELNKNKNLSEKKAKFVQNIAAFPNKKKKKNVNMLVNDI